MSVASEVFVGIDVSKAELEVCWVPQLDRLQVAREEAGLLQLVERLKALGPDLVVLEASGGYEMPVVMALAGAGLPCVVVNARQVRDFAKASGKLAKTDRIDARVIAEFAQAIRPQVRALPDEAAAQLIALVARRRQLVEMLTAEQNRLALSHAAVREDVKQNIAWLKSRLQDLDTEITRAVRSSPCGARAISSCNKCPAWEGWSRRCCLRCCPSWDDSHRRESPPSWAYVPSIARAARGTASAPSSAAAPACARSCIWPSSQPSVGIR